MSEFTSLEITASRVVIMAWVLVKSESFFRSISIVSQVVLAFDAPGWVVRSHWVVAESATGSSSTIQMMEVVASSSGMLASFFEISVSVSPVHFSSTVEPPFFSSPFLSPFSFSSAFLGLALFAVSEVKRLFVRETTVGTKLAAAIRVELVAEAGLSSFWSSVDASLPPRWSSLSSFEPGSSVVAKMLSVSSGVSEA